MREFNYFTGEWEPQDVVADLRWPASVWVAVCLNTTVVNVRVAPATQPLSGGRNAIFQQGQVSQQELFRAEVVGVALSEDEAEQMVQAHKVGKVGGEYSVTEHSIGLRPQRGVPEVPDGRHPCLVCQQELLPAGRSFCPKCEQERWANSGWVPSSAREE